MPRASDNAAMRVTRCPRCRAEDIAADAHPARVLSNGVSVQVFVCRSCYRPTELEYRIACETTGTVYHSLPIREALRALHDHGFKAIYFSGYSFAIGHLGTTDMDLYANVEIADAARRTVSALRKFQLTCAVGDPEKNIAPRHLDIPPVIVDMDGGYGNIFNVQRTAELYVNAGVAAAHIEDQVLPKRCGHIGGKALVATNEMVGKLRMARAVADDCGNPEFVLIARTDGLSAVDAPEAKRGMELAVERGLRYLDTGIPDLLWCEFPTSDRAPVETFCGEIQKRSAHRCRRWYCVGDPTRWRGRVARGQAARARLPTSRSPS